MSYEQKPRLTLFTNKNEGKPIKKQDGSFVVKADGEQILQGSFNAKINLPEGLPAGDYEVSVYRSIAKSGIEYFAGNIKKAWVKKETQIDQHSKAKADAYQSQADEAFDDEIPF